MRLDYKVLCALVAFAIALFVFERIMRDRRRARRMADRAYRASTIGERGKRPIGKVRVDGSEAGGSD